MDKRTQEYKKDKRKIEDYKKNPMINFADSINRSTTGDLDSLTKGSCLSNIITIIIIIGVLFLLSRCSK